MSAAAELNGLVSHVRKDGKPVVRMRVLDYGSQWVVECDVYPVDKLAVAPQTAGPYVHIGLAPQAAGFDIDDPAVDLAAGRSGDRIARER